MLSQADGKGGRTLVDLAEKDDAGEACVRVVRDGGVVEEDALISSVASWDCIVLAAGRGGWVTHAAAIPGFGLHVFVRLFDEHGGWFWRRAEGLIDKSSMVVAGAGAAR